MHKARFLPKEVAVLGFSLIELLVVLGILAVLSSLVAPRFYKQVEAAKEAVLRENLRTTRKAIDDYFGDRGRYPDSLGELVTLNYLKTLPIDPITESVEWDTVAPPSEYRGLLFDVHSKSKRQGLNGQIYSSW